MNKQYKVAIVGFAHSHLKQLYTAFNQLPGGVDWIGCADVKPYEGSETGSTSERMEAAGKEIPLPKVFDNYLDLLDAEPDIALVCTDNKNHAIVVEQLLARGIHTVVEKPMATDLQEGLRMARAAKSSQATLAINWPVTWHPAFRLAQELTQKGTVGDPLRFHYSNPESLGPYSHGKNPPDDDFKARQWWYQQERGGGSMLDYCGYGCTLSRWFLGERATKSFGVKANMLSSFSNVEDYSTMTICYSSAIAILEGSWATVSRGGIVTGPVIYGSEGTLISDRYSDTVKIYKTLHGKGADEEYKSTTLPEDRANIALELDYHIRTGEPLHPTLDLPVNLDALAALDAGIRSAQSGKMESVYIDEPG
jgi:predicted dehydrogenase